MLGPDDLAAMRDNSTAIRGDHEENIVIRRDVAGVDTTRPAQKFRIVRPGTGRSRRVESDGAEQSEADVLLYGAIDADVQAHDRFTLNGVLYEVRYVRTNRTVHTVAETMVQE